jgi:hypothetical protein
LPEELLSKRLEGIALQRFLEHALLPAQVAKGPDVGETESKPVLTLIAHWSQNEPPIFEV